jgi:arginyl-tRNA synthetase
MERYARLAAQALNSVLETPVQPSDLEIPPDPRLGDFAFPCFRLAKQFRKGPPQVAAQIVADLKAKGAVPAGLEVIQAGPYVNFKAPAQEALGSLLKDMLAGPGLGAYGQLPAGSRGNWVLEFSSPNVAKPFNIYHLRPTALGAALDRVGRFRGFHVTSINHLGDWGTQYGKLAVAFARYGRDLPADPSIDDLVKIYVKFHEDAEKDPALEDQAREAFRKLEQGDPEVTALWKKCVDISLKEFMKLYARLGVHFDHFWGESFYKNQLDPLIADLRKKGLLVESEGAWVVPVTDRDGQEIPPCILQKKDGGTIYATRDVAAAIYRMEKLHFDRMTYIVGKEQQLHFQQVFGVLRKLGCEWESRCEHVPTGLYRFKDAKMSTRKGNFVTLEEVLELAKDRVRGLLRDRAAQNPETAKATAGGAGEAIAEAVAIGAVVFHDLHNDPARDIEFDVERVVDFEGETGPYLQYAHTRCLSILRKAADSGYANVEFNASFLPKLGAPAEIQLVKTLGQLPLHLERTLTHAKASQLAHYLIDVVKAFGVFYRECHVLGDEPDLTRARLMLVEATRRVLARGLGLLGIPLPERM